jgi:hypothetical protein
VSVYAGYGGPGRGGRVLVLVHEDDSPGHLSYMTTCHGRQAVAYINVDSLA